MSITIFQSSYNIPFSQLASRRRHRKEPNARMVDSGFQGTHLQLPRVLHILSESLLGLQARAQWDTKGRSWSSKTPRSEVAPPPGGVDPGAAHSPLWLPERGDPGDGDRCQSSWIWKVMNPGCQDQGATSWDPQLWPVGQDLRHADAEHTAEEVRVLAGPRWMVATTG